MNTLLQRVWSAKIKTIELFSGLESFSAVMRKHGHGTFTVDNNPSFHPDKCLDLGTAGPEDLQLATFGRTYPDILWASPPCEGFSVASIGKNWTGGYRGYEPKSESARRSIHLAKSAIAFIELIEPKWWFIENPRGLLRKMPFMEDFLKETGAVRHTVWYCRYGDTRAKPTDIWTNALWWTPRAPCNNGNKNHIVAPRGARTGTQGIRGYKDRSRIPAALFEEILAQMSN